MLDQTVLDKIENACYVNKLGIFVMSTSRICRLWPEIQETIGQFMFAAHVQNLPYGSYIYYRDIVKALEQHTPASKFVADNGKESYTF